MRRLLFCCLGIALVAAAIGFAVHERRSGSAERPAGEKTTPVGTTTRSCRPDEIDLGSVQVSYAAFVRRRVNVYRRPDGALLARLSSRSESFVSGNRRGVPTVLAALAELRANDCLASWYRVRLAGKPGVSGAKEGYVRADAIALVKVRSRVLVDLSQRKLTLFEDGVPVLSAPAAVGAPSTPTPRGRFIARERIRITDSSGAYGAAAIALSGFSEKLIYWPQGGPVAIHGTNEPGSIGKALSHGCVRLGARDLARVFAKVQIGTPVEIVE
ncbi:MAG TPA: L,D-transpeptidase [Gaiellaceae bacterium]